MKRYRLAGAAIAGCLVHSIAMPSADSSLAYSLILPTIDGQGVDQHITNQIPDKNSNMTKINSTEFFRIQLLCPKSHRNELISVSRNRSGQMDRYQVFYNEGKGTKIIVSAAEINSPFQVALSIDLLTEKKKDNIELATLLMQQGNNLMKEVCRGSDMQRRNFKTTLETNLRLLGVSSEDYPSNF